MEIARPGGIGEVRGMSAVGHEPHPTFLDAPLSSSPNEVATCASRMIRPSSVSNYDCLELVGVPGRRQQADPRWRLDLALVLDTRCAGEVDPFADRVVLE